RRAVSSSYLLERGTNDTPVMWRDDFADNLANGFDDQGNEVPHDHRSRVRVAGSMDTTITDLTHFAAALVRGEGLSRASRAEMTRGELPITTAHQFPTLQAELPPALRRADLSAGLGVVTFMVQRGPGF